MKEKYPYNPDVSVLSHGQTSNVKPYLLDEATALTKEGTPYVIDRQIPFAIDLSSFPVSKSVRSIKHAHLKMKVNKLSKERKLGSELLCFTDQKICSGEFILLEHWIKAINTSYYGHPNQLANDYFSQVLLDKTTESGIQGTLYSKELTLDLEKLIENSPETLKHLLSNRTLQFVVADDIFIEGNVTLELGLVTKGCSLE